MDPSGGPSPRIPWDRILEPGFHSLALNCRAVLRTCGVHPNPHCSGPSATRSSAPSQFSQADTIRHLAADDSFHSSPTYATRRNGTGHDRQLLKEAAAPFRAVTRPMLSHRRIRGCSRFPCSLAFYGCPTVRPNKILSPVTGRSRIRTPVAS